MKTLITIFCLGFAGISFGQSTTYTSTTIGGTTYTNGSDGSRYTSTTIGGTTYTNGSDGSRQTETQIGDTTYTNIYGVKKKTNSVYDYGY